mmetsp:Transcript_112816/g.364347  ORF Transcript_112816/g.364347 Transcript_112816/m.364347 type:complete len:213 (-) Transcript_112816:208-846(-)
MTRQRTGFPSYRTPICTSPTFSTLATPADSSIPPIAACTRSSSRLCPGATPKQLWPGAPRQQRCSSLTSSRAAGRPRHLALRADHSRSAGTCPSRARSAAVTLHASTRLSSSRASGRPGGRTTSTCGAPTSCHLPRVNVCHRHHHGSRPRPRLEPQAATPLVGSEQPQDLLGATPPKPQLRWASPARSWLLSVVEKAVFRHAEFGSMSLWLL